MKKKLFGLCLAVFAGVALIGCGDKHSHDFSTLIPKENPTCTASGMEAYYKCSCGKYFNVNRQETTLEELVLDPLGHNYEDTWITDTDPTCLDKGHQHRDCTRCGQDGRETRDTDALGHNMTLVAKVDSTCVVAGHQAYYKCSRKNCEHYSTDKDGKLEIKDIAIWLAEGGEGYIAPTGVHKYEENAKAEFLVSPADCTNAAVYKKSCSCGQASSETFVYGDPLGHNYGDLIPKVNKTCTTDGFDAHYYCDRCENYFTTAKVQTTQDALVIKAGHEISADPAVDPDFENPGHIAGYTCSECKGHYSDAEGKNPIEQKDWEKAKLASTEDLTKTLYVDLSVGENGAIDDCDTGLDGYTFLQSDAKTPVSWEGKQAGDQFTCYAVKDGATSYKISVLVATKVIKTANEFLDTLNLVKRGVDSLSGYFVLGADIEGLYPNSEWVDWNKVMSGTLDGRNHTLKRVNIGNSTGLFGAYHCESFTMKNINFDGVFAGSYGLLGYVIGGITLENIKITSLAYQHSSSFICREMRNVKFVNCEIDNTAMPNQGAIATILTNPVFEDTKVTVSLHAQQTICKFTDAGSKVAYAGEFDDKVTLLTPTYKHVDAAEASFKEGAHIAGYTCSECGKHFSDTKHQTEIPDAQYYTSEKLPTTKVEGKQVFYNLATSAYDITEVPTLDTTKLVDAYCKPVSLAGLNAGTAGSVYLPGETNYEYEYVVVTDVIAAEGDFATKLNASAKDLVGYFVFTKDLGTVNTVAGGSNSTQTAVQVTVDGRNHSINLMVIKSAAGGMFGSCGSGKAYDVVFKNLVIKKSALSAYGMFGYHPANTTGQSLLIENCDITAGGSSGNRYGVLCTLSNVRIALKNVTIDFTQNDFSGGQEVKSGSYVFQDGARGTYENVKIIILIAHDTYKNNYTEGAKTYTDVIKPDAIIGKKAAEERDSGSLVSKLSGVTFLTARP